jgi:hypothetical protein
MKVKIPVENNFKGRNRDVDQELDQERRSNKENRGDAARADFRRRAMASVQYLTRPIMTAPNDHSSHEGILLHRMIECRFAVRKPIRFASVAAIALLLIG